MLYWLYSKGHVHLLLTTSVFVMLLEHDRETEGTCNKKSSDVKTLH